MRANPERFTDPEPGKASGLVNHDHLFLGPAQFASPFGPKHIAVPSTFPVGSTRDGLDWRI